ncbi:LuxR C-terminal-related transcriptional regulator [Lysinibacillus sphaericus]|uniref:LuxR C-terminal-related transcriptional regulator n=1 Tax=Lysinibacillus sphaericus TaxID=1421 RepID=UPI00248B7701|nr:LuxR C-terminal-related transcriptional regulator [Lysinibacillus sphaericus]
MEKEYEYSVLATFVNLHKEDLQKFIVNDIYLNTGFTSSTCNLYTTMSESLIDLIHREYKNKSINIIRNVMEKWYLKYQLSISQDSIEVIENVLNKSVEEYGSDSTTQIEIKKELKIIFEVIYFILGVTNLKIVKPYSEVRTDSITEIVEILISHQEHNGIVHTLKKIEELFSFKRSSYYSFVPETRGIIGVFGQEMKKIKMLKVSLTSQKPLELAYQTKKAIYIKDARLHFDDFFIKEFQLVSLVIVPVYSHKTMYGWLILDNVGQVFNLSLEELEDLERIGKLLGVYIDTRGLYVMKEEVGILSPREQDVLKLLAEGYENKAIGEELHLSSNTVRDYVSHLMMKLDAKNRTHLVALSLRKQIIQ